MAAYCIYESPIGKMILKVEKGCITELNFVRDGMGDLVLQKSAEEKDNEVADRCIRQLDEYFQGARKTFDLPLDNQGTEFRMKAWKELEKIPFGKTATYKELAVAVGNPKAVRAIGGANHNNNISIIVPCHRVIGSNGKLVGYGGGLWRKEWLLAHEKKYLEKE